MKRTISIICYRIAAVVALLGALAHEFVGTSIVLTPLEGSGISSNIIWLHHFSWHVGTICALSIAIMFLSASMTAETRVLAATATAVSAGLALLGIGLAIFGNEVMWTTPAPFVWTLVAVAGGIGLTCSSAKGVPLCPQ